MNPLMLMIPLGDKDDQLLQIIGDLERIDNNPTMGRLSEGERDLLDAAYRRLNRITRPLGPGESR